MEKIKSEDIIEKSTITRLRETARATTIIRKNFDWLKHNGIQFVEPIHKTMAEIELEANRIFGAEDCSNDKNIFINAAMWASNNQ